MLEVVGIDVLHCHSVSVLVFYQYVGIWSAVYKSSVWLYLDVYERQRVAYIVVEVVFYNRKVFAHQVLETILFCFQSVNLWFSVESEYQIVVNFQQLSANALNRQHVFWHRGNRIEVSRVVHQYSCFSVEKPFLRTCHACPVNVYRCVFILRQQFKEVAHIGISQFCYSFHLRYRSYIEVDVGLNGVFPYFEFGSFHKLYVHVVFALLKVVSRENDVQWHGFVDNRLSVVDSHFYLCIYPREFIRSEVECVAAQYRCE